MSFIQENIKDCNSTSLLLAEKLRLEQLLSRTAKALAPSESESINIGLNNNSGVIIESLDRLFAIKAKLQELQKAHKPFRKLGSANL